MNEAVTLKQALSSLELKWMVFHQHDAQTVVDHIIHASSIGTDRRDCFLSKSRIRSVHSTDAVGEFGVR